MVMLVEDDAHIADMMLNYLSASGFDTCHHTNGLTALQHLQQAANALTPSNIHPPDSQHTTPKAVGCSTRMPDLLLLDLMLPGMDGMAVCAEVRRFSTLPIIMVTARVDEIDRLLGLDSGADDYICKPFSPREVVARVRANLRRVTDNLLTADSALPAATAAPVALQLDTPVWAVSSAHQQVFWRGKPLPLTTVEFRLFQLLTSRPGQVFGRSRLLEQLHEDQRDVSDRAIDSHSKNIRRKLADAGADSLHISSVYGVGYRFEQTD